MSPEACTMNRFGHYSIFIVSSRFRSHYDILLYRLSVAADSLETKV
jgi:hypothetical protein